jgi:hypothetical protein
VGRTLNPLPIHRTSNLRSPITGRLWPDSIVSIINSHEDWYRVSGGYVQREGIQPMTPYTADTNIQLSDTAFWAEVAGPVASVRQWCAADAPLVARIGHGGTARVIDSLPGDQIGAFWYGIEADIGGLMGWTQAVHWRPVQDESAASSLRLHVDRATQQLTAYEDDEAVLQASISTGTDIEPGVYPVQARQVTGMWLSATDSHLAFHGLPWRISFGERHELSGVYWHNQFGKPIPGPAIQVTPLLARWLYPRLDGQIVIS